MYKSQAVLFIVVYSQGINIVCANQLTKKSNNKSKAIVAQNRKIHIKLIRITAIGLINVKIKTVLRTVRGIVFGIHHLTIHLSICLNQTSSFNK